MTPLETIMATRRIVQIDEAKCDGCGECIPNCPEGALKIIDGKARLVRDKYCDGLGACLGTCPQDAITIVEREAEDFDQDAVVAQQSHEHAHSLHEHKHAPHESGCPGAAVMDISSGQEADTETIRAGRRPSALTQWPVQLYLVPSDAPFFDGADVLLAADCTPFALADFHERLLPGRKLLVACPKLDDTTIYEKKLTAILRENGIRSLTVVHMEVPCCYGLVMLARKAVQLSGKDIPVENVTVTLRGGVRENQEQVVRSAPQE